MDGFLIVDKPKGLTSHDVIARLRAKLNQSKIGHTGTLDPMATGVMIVGIGKATRLLEYLMRLDKTYLAEVTLGFESTTFDAEGDIEELELADENKPDEETVREALKDFTGEIYQIPPVYSAVKINGERSYKLARNGKPQTPPMRKVKIHSIELIAYKYPSLTIRVACGSGTYIRTIAHDLGQKLKTGAYLSALNREKISDFDITKAAELSQVDISNVDRYLMPLNEAQGQFPAMALTSPEYERLQRGQAIKTRRTYTPKTPIFAYFQNELIAIMEYDVIKQRLRPRKVFV